MKGEVPLERVLQPIVKRQTVGLHAHDVGAAVEGVSVTRRMPRGSGGKLGSLQQQHIVKPQLRQVVENARPRDASADHGHLSRDPHATLPRAR